jgi:hypothetical protein
LYFTLLFFWNHFILNTAKTKRWNGKIETLSVEYLKRVMDQMLAYGDRVQFALTRGGQRPHYQVINTSDKKIPFDSNHLLTPGTDDFIPGTTSPVYTLEKVEAAMKGVGTKTVSTRSAGGSRSSSGGTGVPRTSAAQKLAVIDAEKYEYFKQNRSTMPEEISKHSQEITALMLNGMPVADAFAKAIESCAY